MYCKEKSLKRQFVIHPMHPGFSQFKKVFYLCTQFYNIILHHDIKQNHRAKKHVEAGSTEIGELEKAFAVYSCSHFSTFDPFTGHVSRVVSKAPCIRCGTTC